MRGLLGFALLATFFSSCLAACQLAEGRQDCYICDGLSNFEQLDIPAGAIRLEIRNSSLARIPSDAFARYGETLAELNIIDSGVEEIEANAFAGLKKLQILRLYGNKLRRIEASWLRDLPHLRSLILYRNRILDIDPEVYDLLAELQVLDVAYNELHECPRLNDVTKLKNLRKVLIAGNPWSLRCRSNMTHYLGTHHISMVKDWSVSDLWVEECLAHEPGAESKDEILQKCVDRMSKETASRGCSLLLNDLNDKLRALSGRLDQLEIDISHLQSSSSPSTPKPSE